MFDVLFLLFVYYTLHYYTTTTAQCSRNDSIRIDYEELEKKYTTINESSLRIKTDYDICQSELRDKNTKIISLQQSLDIINDQYDHHVKESTVSIGNKNYNYNIIVYCLLFK
jgi:hypothetical protein